MFDPKKLAELEKLTKEIDEISKKIKESAEKIENHLKQKKTAIKDIQKLIQRQLDNSKTQKPWPTKGSQEKN